MDPTMSSLSRQIHPKSLQLCPNLKEFTSASSPSLVRLSSARLNFPHKSKPIAIRRRITASAAGGSEGDYLSPWDDKPYEVLPTGRISYLDEQDIACFLDPPKELIPIDPDSYNPAAYLWKKIGDVPEERRPCLLSLLKPRLISSMWEVAGTRYQDAKLAKQSASTLLSMDDSPMGQEVWVCRTSKGPLPIAWNWINDFKKAIFRGKDGGTYGRIILGGLSPAGVANLYGPLYFTVRQVSEVMSTEQPCDLAYEFGDGLLDFHDFPEGFPEPVEHRWPFNDHLVIYVRHAGPGVLVGQAWQEGKDLEQVPKKFCVLSPLMNQSFNRSHAHMLDTYSIPIFVATCWILAGYFCVLYISFTN